MSVVDYLRSIGRNWVAVVALAVLGAVGGFVVSSATPDLYRSTSALLLTSDRGGSTSELVQGSTYVQNLVSTYVLLANSEIVLQPVIEELDLDTSAQALATTVSASSPLDTVIIDITAVSRDPELAQAIASSVTGSLITVVTEDVSPTSVDGTPTVRLTTIQNATLPRFPFEPNTRLNVLLGGLIGLVLGVAFAVVRSLLWQTVRTPEDVAQVTTAPVIGEVVETARDATLPRAILTDPLGIEAESSGASQPT